MSLIRCKECGHEISDKAKACPYCGAPVENEVEFSETGESGEDSPKNETKCENENKEECGDTEEPAKDASKSKRKKIIIICIIAAAVIAVSVIGYNVHKSNVEQATLEQYNSDIYDYEAKAADLGADCAAIDDLTVHVWYNCMFEEDDKTTNKYTKKNGVFYDDFNDALQSLFESNKYTNLKSNIETKKAKLDDLYSAVQDSSAGTQEEYDAVKALNEVAGDFYTVATTPTGSYDDYSTEAIKAGNSFMSKYNALDAILN